MTDREEEETRKLLGWKWNNIWGEEDGGCMDIWDMCVTLAISNGSCT